MSAQGCIIYLLPSDMLWLDAKLEGAQRHALKEKLPLAVVSCLTAKEYNEHRPVLLALEATLSRYNMPFIVLLGKEKEVLADFVKTTRPAYVYGHGGAQAGRVKLVEHPHKWMSATLPINELQKLIDKNARI